MNIISENQESSRIEDGISTLLSLDDESFNKVLENLLQSYNLEKIYFFYPSDSCSSPEREVQLGLETKFDEDNNYIGRGYYEDSEFSIHEIFSILQEKLENTEENSEMRNRILKILKARDLETLKSWLMVQCGKSKEFVDKVISIVADDATFQKFINYENNREFFSIEGKEIEKSEYLRTLGKAFGKVEYGMLDRNSTIMQEFFIPEIDELKTRYIDIAETINMTRYTNPDYEFRYDPEDYFTIREGEEPDWSVGEELRTAVLEDMPENLSLEEKAFYIYFKLCKELSYDDGYLFNKNLENGTYTSDFSKDRLESIKRGSKVTCWDLARVYSKLINTELDGDIEAVIISKGIGKGHFKIGICSDRVSYILEPVNLGVAGNDLTKIKNGIGPDGIEIKYDEGWVMPETISRAFEAAIGKKKVHIAQYIAELKGQKKEEVPNDIEKKFKAFLETLRQNKIYGNEAIQTFKIYELSGFFEEKLGLAYIGSRENRDGKKTYKMMSLIRTTENGETKKIYLFNPEALEINEMDFMQVKEKIDSGEFVWEDKDYKIPGID